jgi:hypothetical protein
MPSKRASLFAFTGGLLHIALAGGLMFLPVFAICFRQGQEVICTHQSYVQQGGNVLGLGLLLLMIVDGVIAIISTRIKERAQARLLRWIAVAATVCFAVTGAWSIGLLFVPAGLLLLLSALL